MSHPDQPDVATTASAPDDLESLSDDQLLKMLEESRIVIKKGGEVIIENLTPGLLEVALELNPDQPSIVCRVDGADDAPSPDSAELSGALSPAASPDAT
jgi:hypothetical protein